MPSSLLLALIGAVVVVAGAGRSMQVPISLDFALSLRQGATSSGFFLSCGVITGLQLGAAGKRLVDEENWNQFYVRRLLIVIPLIAMALSFASAIFINETSGSEQVYLIWWVMIGFTVAGSFIGPLSVIPGIIFWTKITKSKNRTFWMILTQCARNLGLVVGPGLFAVLRTAVTGGGDRVCPRSMMGWVNLTLLVFSLISASFGAFVMPARMPDYPLNLEEDDEDDPDELVMASDAHLEAMPEPERERVVWNMIWYAFERPFTLAAVEVSTLMMLEVYYGNSKKCICFTAVCSLGIVMSIGTTVALVKGWVIESHVFIISAASSIIGCLFLVEIGRDSYYRQYGVQRDSSIEHAAVEAIGSKALRRDSDTRQNHLFVWGSGMGADGPFSTWRKWVPNAIFMMTETELWNPYKDVVEPSFTRYKDILVPGRLTVDDMISLGKLARPMDERDNLGHFIGWPRPPHPSVLPPETCQDSSCSLNVRSVLLALKEKEPLFHVDVDVPYVESFIGLTSSLFCFVPRGKSAWSSRFFQTFFAGCIPVLLNDRYDPPFGEFVDLPSAVIKWPMTQVPALVDYLKQLAFEDAERMSHLLEAGKALKCWYAWPPSWIEWSWLELNKSKFNVANGFAEGWASRAAKEGTSFSNAEYRLRQLSAVTVSRFMGPIVGRFLVDYGGRNVYAVAQLVMCLMGTRTVYKTVGLIWRWNRANPQVSVKDTEVPAAEKLLKGEAAGVFLAG
ncbi:rib-1 [Symbiodinium microadriaticum]|nr:rib-1 [Symbiodinium microadriaticum]